MRRGGAVGTGPNCVCCAPFPDTAARPVRTFTGPGRWSDLDNNEVPAMLDHFFRWRLTLASPGSAHTPVQKRGLRVGKDKPLPTEPDQASSIEASIVSFLSRWRLADLRGSFPPKLSFKLLPPCRVLAANPLPAYLLCAENRTNVRRRFT